MKPTSLTAFKMEIVSKLPEPNLVWNIFSYVAEAPLTKEKRKYIEYWRNQWSENGEYDLFPKFVEYCVSDIAQDLEDEIDNLELFDRRPLSIQLKLFENQEYDWTQQSSEDIDKWLFDKWDVENAGGFEYYILLYAKRSIDTGVKLQLTSLYSILPPRFAGIAEEEYRKIYNSLLHND